MRLYIDLSCFNRPFDNQAQDRIRLETEAVLVILTRIVEGTDTLLWSWVLSFENDKHPKRDRRDEIAVWERRAERSIDLSGSLEDRSRRGLRNEASPHWMQPIWRRQSWERRISC
jgi:hypothetical protein